MSVDPHPASEEVAYLSVRQIHERFSAGTLDSVTLVESLLARANAIDGADTTIALRSLAAVSEDALDDAAARDDERRHSRADGPLHGIPVLVKDNIEARGLPGTAGSTSLVGRPATDAPLVTRLRAAGAIVLGSTNLSQWANMRSTRSSSGWSATGGLVANPWALDRSAGGSSSGSGAAVAAGLSPLSVGTETDGSIVCPASLTGVVGLKPTVGVVPTEHVVPISASQDSPGPMGRGVDDVARLFGVLANQEPPGGRGEPSTFAVATTWQSGHPRTDEIIADAVARLRAGGLSITDRQPPTPGDQESRDELTVLVAELCDDLSSYLHHRDGEGVRSLADVIAFEDRHREVEMPYFGHELLEMAVASGGRRGPDYGEARARNLEWALSECLVPTFEGVDILLSAGFVPAWKSDLVVSGHPVNSASCVTMPAAIAGWPIMAVPVGLCDGLPVALAMVARPYEEWRLLEAARLVEEIVRDGDPFPRPAWREPSRG